MADAKGSLAVTQLAIGALTPAESSDGELEKKTEIHAVQEVSGGSSTDDQTNEKTREKLTPSDDKPNDKTATIPKAGGPPGGPNAVAENPFQKPTDLFEKYNGLAGSKGDNPNRDETNGKKNVAEFIDVTEVEGYGDRRDVFRTGSNMKRRPESETKFGEYSLVLRRVYSQDPHQPPRKRIEIRSLSLRNAFRIIARGCPSISLYRKPIIIKEPFRELYYYRDKIDQAIKRESNENLKKELMLFLAFEREFLSAPIQHISELTAEKTITFDLHWALFPPKELVVLQNRRAALKPIYTCAIVEDYHTFTNDDGTFWKLDVTVLGFDGAKFGNVKQQHIFTAFNTVVEIASLPAYPIKYHPDEGKLREYLIKRGKKYEELCRESLTSANGAAGTHRRYVGPVWVATRSGEDCGYYDTPGLQLCERMIVDPLGLVQELPPFRTELIPDSYDESDLDALDEVQRALDDFDSNDFNLDMWRNRHPGFGYGRRSTLTSAIKTIETLQFMPQSLPEDKLLISPATIGGYALGEKKWGFFTVENMEAVTWQDNAYDRLQLDPGQKRVIQTLVLQHNKAKTDFDDLITGKGRGLVVLLHGPPGCGKTMTAESIAESLHLPLYAITSGELGSQVEEMESPLRDVFRLAARWKALLLLDEADVFMTKREDGNIERNSVVSIFLRLLEYQSGVIFLTTNRKDDFDHAFHSRIHITIPYDLPSQQSRKLIWQHLTEKVGKSDISEAEFDKLGVLELSGRNVKNILRVASLYAHGRDEDASLELRDIKAVLEMAIGSLKLEADALNAVLRFAKS